MHFKRTHYCGAIRIEHREKEVVLTGWVDRWRDHGGVIFIDLRDREGIIQVVFDPSLCKVALASGFRQEYVIAVKGRVRSRPIGMENKNLPTGELELAVSDYELLNKSLTPPFLLHEDSPSSGETDESLRLTYRYLDLRRQPLQKNIRIRHLFLKAVREFYYTNGFWEIETPILYKSTPEGARDYLVPSRLQPGHFYALPQSPQTLKQLCMIAGFDKYVQIARCFRDEDLRADRQPEFTQIDVEMSFIEPEDLFDLHEKLMQKIWKEVLDIDIKTPFQKIKYSQAMEKYGSDKPDLRNSLTLINLTDQGKRCGFELYREAIEKGAQLKALCFEEKEPLPRSELDNLLKKVRAYGAKGVSWIRIKSPGDWQSPQAKFFDEKLKKEVETLLSFKKSSMLFLICDYPMVTNPALGSLRLEYGEKFGYQTGSQFEFLWVTDFPLFEYNENEKRFYAAHHPFTRPHPDDISKFMTQNQRAELEQVRACAYDLVLNGVEIGGGSLRIFDPSVQARMFEVLGISLEEAKSKFGFFLKALQFGTPPHGGIALGADRIAMLLAGTDAIRDVIAFPKTQRATCLMSEAPSPVDESQMRTLFLKHVKPD